MCVNFGIYFLISLSLSHTETHIYSATYDHVRCAKDVITHIIIQFDLEYTS